MNQLKVDQIDKERDQEDIIKIQLETQKNELVYAGKISEERGSTFPRQTAKKIAPVEVVSLIFATKS